MIHRQFWERLASRSIDRGEYFPSLDPRVERWNNIEEIFIKKNVINVKQNVLDIGCGDGRALFWLKQRGFKKLYGMDISKIALDRCKQKLGKSVKLKWGDYRDGIRYKEKFGCVLLMGNTIIADLKNPVKLLKEIKNLMIDDGILLITCWNGNFLNEKFVDSYYRKIFKTVKFFPERRVVVIEEIRNRWLLEKELKNIINKSRLKIIKFRKIGLGFLCKLSK
jgi:SAM-dependent methyltransferase